MFRFSQGQLLPDRQLRSFNTRVTSIRNGLVQWRKRLESALERIWAAIAREEESNDSFDRDNGGAPNPHGSDSQAHNWQGPTSHDSGSHGSTSNFQAGGSHGSGADHMSGGHQLSRSSDVRVRDAYAEDQRRQPVRIQDICFVPNYRSLNASMSPSALPSATSASLASVPNASTNLSVNDLAAGTDSPSLIDDNSSDDEFVAPAPKVHQPRPNKSCSVPSQTQRSNVSKVESDTGDIGPVPMAKHVSAMFLSSLAQISNHRMSDSKCNWKDRHDYIRNTIGVLKSLEFNDVLHFVTSIHRYGVLHPFNDVFWFIS
jgi:hypothetical protein